MVPSDGDRISTPAFRNASRTASNAETGKEATAAPCLAIATPLLLPRGLCRSDFRLDKLAQLLVLALDCRVHMAVLQQLLRRLHQIGTYMMVSRVLENLEVEIEQGGVDIASRAFYPNPVGT